ncbi:hypothetical protein PHEL85_2893 [Polaribacter sp. Hel1_85]|nr:hypothetical protein PHEL85_2893 [Polaribacter sp. Hel1_85]
MRQKEDTTYVTSSNKNSNLYRSKPSILNQITIWFRDFIENAE